MVDRLLSALWVPVLVILATAATIIGIGEILLAVAVVKQEMWGVKEPLSIMVALFLALAILLGAAWLARAGRSSQH